MKFPEWLEKRLVWRRQSEENYNQPKQLKEIIYEESDCDSCGRCLVQPRSEFGRFNIKPYRHWRWQCNICRKYYNEQTGKFDMTPAELTNYMVEKNKS
jgi:hypothetical protein